MQLGSQVDMLVFIAKCIRIEMSFLGLRFLGSPGKAGKVGMVLCLGNPASLKNA